MTARDRSRDVLDVLLVLHVAHDHGLDDLARSFGVSMDAIGAFLLDQGVPAVVELRDVPAEVLDQGKLAAGVLPFIAVCVEDEVVENDELLTAFHLDIDHLRRILLHI